VAPRKLAELVLILQALSVAVLTGWVACELAYRAKARR
jgi:hypothetical protein